VNCVTANPGRNSNFGATALAQALQEAFFIGKIKNQR
jgi:hypothetical protein